MPTSNYINQATELDARAVDGIDVRLFWHPTTDAVTISVFDATNEQAFELVVDSSEAREAFHHPFAYAAFQGIAFATPLRAHDEEQVAAWNASSRGNASGVARATPLYFASGTGPPA